MGNRANVVFVSGETISPAIYLHWNGGPESVYALLAELDRRGCRPDAEYEAARFVVIVGEFFDHDAYTTLSLGIVNGPEEITSAGLAKVYTDMGDNGFYVVDRTKNPRLVRRFTLDWHTGPNTLREWTQEEVEREAETALTAPGMPGYAAIVESFSTNGKPLEANLFSAKGTTT